MRKFFDKVSKVFKTDPNQVGDDGMTRLQRAIINDDEAKVRKLIDDGADVNEAGMLNYQPLHLSLTRDRSQIALMLIEASADIHAADNTGRSPLHIAAAQGHEFIMLRLLKLGANPNNTNKKGQTALHVVSPSKADMISYLCHFKANVNAVDCNNDTPLNIFIRNKQLQLVEPLLAAGADPNIKNNTGVNAVTFVLNDENMLKDEKLLMQLIRSGANMEARNKDGENALFCMVRIGNKRVFDRLLPTADLKARTRLGSNVLHSALLNGTHSVLPDLLRRKPDLMREVNHEGQTPLAAYLSRVYFGSGERFESAVKLLVAAGGDINTVDNKGRSLVHYACRNNRIEFLEFLIAAGANLDLKSEEGQAPIHTLIETRNMVMLDMILDAGADPDQVDSRGWTILDRQAEKNDRDSPTVQRLIVAGAQYQKQLPLRPELMRQKKPATEKPDTDNTVTPSITRIQKPFERKAEKPPEASEEKKMPPRNKGPKFG